MATLGKSKKMPQKMWRPDFRNVETLPDTKVIRTDFLLNFVSIALAAVCLILYGYKELELQGLAKSIRELQDQVQGATSDNRKLLDVNKKFLQSADFASEVIAFDAEPIRFANFLAEIGDALQEGMVISSLSMNHSGELPGESGLPPFNIQLMGIVFEQPTITPAQVLSDYQEALRGLASLSGKELEVEIVRFNRNNEFGYFDFTLLIKITLEKAPAL